MANTFQEGGGVRPDEDKDLVGVFTQLKPETSPPASAFLKPDLTNTRGRLRAESPVPAQSSTIQSQLPAHQRVNVSHVAQLRPCRKQTPVRSEPRSQSVC